MTVALKPGKWSVNPADIDPIWLSYWDGLQAVYDIGTSPLPFDLGLFRRHATGFDNGFDAGTLVNSSIGYGRDFNSTTGEGIIIPEVEVYVDQITVMAVVSTTSTNDELGFRHVTDRHPAWFLNHHKSTTRLRFAVTADSEVSTLVAATADYNDGKVHVVVGTYDGATIRGYLDGALSDFQTLTGDINLGSGVTRIGGYGGGGSGEWPGQIFMTAYWNRALSPGEIKRLAADPFGFIRQGILLTDDAGGAGSASPAVIARSFTVDAVTQTGPGNITPATTVRAFTVDDVTLLGQTSVRPDAIARSFTVDAPTFTGPGNITPGAIVRAFTVDAVTTDSGSTAGDASPAAIIRAFTVDPVTQTGPGNITPSAIARAFTVDAVTLLGQTTVRPDVIARAFTVDGVTVSGAGNITPGAIVRVFVIPAVTTSSGAVVTPVRILFIQDPGVW